MSPRQKPAVAVSVLVALGVVLAALAAREGQRRSLIPLAIDAVVGARELRTEKHPGQDDRYYLTLSDDAGTRVVEVQGDVFAAVAEGQRLVKTRGERILLRPDGALPLQVTGDSTRLAWILIAGAVAPLLQALARLRNR